MDNIGKNQLVFNDVFIVSSASVVGPKESKGPFGNYFDKCYDNLLCNNESSFEKAEMRMMEDALIISLDKANLSDKDINCAFCGDLNNQIIIGNYVLRNYDIPYVGIFGACSTSILGIIMGAIYLQNMKGNVICLTSSHNGTSERQFRYPNEYGAQKAETATLTVTGASSVILTNMKNENDIKITKATIGKVIDPKINDIQDMGRIMAPSAFNTILDHLNNYDETIDDYDLIVTGDLSKYGSDMLIKLFKEINIDIKDKYIDSGNCIFDKNKQEVLAGGSGCGCLGVFLSGYLLEKLKNRELRKILCVGTGALLNPVIVCQKETIPGISHAITIEVSS